MAGGDLCWAFASLLLQCLVEARSCLGGHMRIRRAAVSSSASQSLGHQIGWLVCWLFGRVNSTWQTANSVSCQLYFLLVLQLSASFSTFKKILFCKVRCWYFSVPLRK